MDGPRELNEAILFDWKPRAATLVTNSELVDGGDCTVEQEDPSFPAETDMKTPAARTSASALARLVGAQPSDGGQP